MRNRAPIPGSGEQAPPAAAFWLPSTLRAHFRLSFSLLSSCPAPACRVQLLGKRQVLQEAMQGLQVALCSQDKLQAQQELLQNKMQQLGTGEPPAVPLLQDDRHSTSSAVRCPATNHYSPPPSPAYLQGLCSSFLPSPSLSLTTR